MCTVPIKNPNSGAAETGRMSIAVGTIAEGLPIFTGRSTAYTESREAELAQYSVKGSKKMETKAKKKLNPYFYLLIIVLSYLTAGFCSYRLQPILTYMMQLMSIDEAKAGTLVSAASILSIFLSVPFGVLMGRIGPRRTGILATLLVIGGSLVGAVASSSFTVMLVSQLIVGAGICATGILGPYVIACLFDPSLRGRANGLYITGGTIAQLVMFNLVPRITTPENIAPAWWFCIVYSIIMLVVWMVFITDEVAPPMGRGEPKDGAKKSGLLDALRDKKVLQLSVGGLFFMMSTMAVMNFTPTFLTLQHGYTEEIAGSLVSVCAIVGAVSTAVGGALSDILKTRKWIYFAALLWMLVSRFLIAFLPAGMLLNIVIWLQGLPSVAMGLLYTVAGEVLDPDKASIGISAINMFIGIGTLIASALFGVLAVSVGYQMAFCVFGGLTIFGFIGICTIKGVK